MKDKAEKLARLGDITATREREAAQRFARCLHKHTQIVRQIDELNVYRQEYGARLDTLGSSGLPAAEANRLVIFISNIDQLISTMSAQARELHEDVQKSEREWRTLKGKVQGFEQLAAERRRRASQQTQQRQAHQLEDAWLAGRGRIRRSD